MMDDSKKRFQIGFIGSLGFHLFVFLVLAFAGLFAVSYTHLTLPTKLEV